MVVCARRTGTPNSTGKPKGKAKAKQLIRGESYMQRRDRQEATARKWRVAHIAARFLGHWMFKLQGGVADDDGPRPGHEFLMSRATVLKHIRELLDQMTSFKRLRNIIFTDFTLNKEVDSVIAARREKQRKEDIMLSMLYTSNHTSKEAAEERHLLQEKAQVLLREGIVSTPRRQKLRSRPLTDEGAAAVKFQALVRGRQARAAQNKRKAAAVAIQRIVRGGMVRSGGWDPKFDGDPLQLKRAGRPGYETDMKEFARAVTKLGDKASLNERRLGSILEEMVWETRQFSRDVAAAWWRRSREMQQQALDRIKHEVSLRLREQKQLFRSVLDANIAKLSPSLAPDGVLTMLERSLALMKNKAGYEPFSSTGDPALGGGEGAAEITPIASRLVTRGFKVKHIESVVAAVKAFKSSHTVFQMAAEGDEDEQDQTFQQLAGVSGSPARPHGTGVTHVAHTSLHNRCDCRH